MYATNFTSQKLRGFVVDKSSARPLPNVIVVLMAQRDQQISTPIGMLVSDGAGYVSFDLNDLPDSTIQRFERLWLYAMGDEMARIDDVRPYILVGMRPSAGTHFLLSADAKLTTQGNRHINLPSVQNPDTIDWELSPHSFAVKPELVLGEGDCQVPHPATAAEREFHLYRVIRQTAEQPIIRDAPVLPIDPLSLPTIDTKRKVQLTFGEVLEFRQSWFPVSHSLGQIVYSLPLAPCESINLAVIEWSRRDTILRRDQVEATM